MKILNFKLTIAILCSIVITFTACSKEEIKTNDPISTNNVASKQAQSGEITIDNSTIKWKKVDKKYLEDLAADYENRAVNHPVSIDNDCDFSYCIKLGEYSKYTIFGDGEGDFTFQGPKELCFDITAPVGSQRDVEYEGMGGVKVEFFNVNCYPCIFWDIPPSPGLNRFESNTFTIPSCIPM